MLHMFLTHNLKHVTFEILKSVRIEKITFVKEEEDDDDSILT